MNWGGIQMCPFYETQSRVRITCEGAEENQKTNIKFENEMQKKAWLGRFCETMDYGLCPYGQMIMRKYEQKKSPVPCVAIGYLLRKAKEEGKIQNIGNYAKREYGISRRNAFRYMRINKEYSAGGFSPILRPEYRDISTTKLVEMIGIPDSQRMLMTGWSLKKIRDYKERYYADTCKKIKKGTEKE